MFPESTNLVIVTCHILIAGDEVEFFIYGNQQDAINGKNRLAGTSITVRPDMSGRIESALYSLPYTYNLLWLGIGFGYELAEDDWIIVIVFLFCCCTNWRYDDESYDQT